jgi:DNA replication and repair protein RecF
MFRLSKITITQFKNYDFNSFSFTERIIGICGLNGRGKTNLLDAIYYLCFTKSYFTKTDGFNIRFNADGFRLEGTAPAQPILAATGKDENIRHNSEDVQTVLNQDKIICIFRGVGKKELLLNDVPYTKFSEHIGKFPCVMIAPDDIEMIIGGSEERRRFMDTVISQINAAYLQQLIIYNKVLMQRNSLLKKFAE